MSPAGIGSAMRVSWDLGDKGDMPKSFWDMKPLKASRVVVMPQNGKRMSPMSPLAVTGGNRSCA
jgi:hypothetical protein